jgi:hypothetical protein
MRLAFVVCVLVLAGCPDRQLAELPPSQAGEIQKDIPVSADIDILFVIDDSSSTQDKQTVFAANFPRFVQALDAFPTGRPNLHIGVVSSTVDIGVGGFGSCSPASLEDGRLQNTAHGASCPVPNGRFLSDVESGGGRITNYAGPLEDNLSCIAQLGTGGCGFEAPLEAMKRALDGSRPENAGFVRPGAFLAVVFLTDEDDSSVKDKAIFSLPPDQAGPGDFRCQPLYAYRCDQPISATTPGSYTNCAVRTDSYLQDPAAYYAFLSTIKPPGRSVVALIAGDPKHDISTGPIPLPNAPALQLQPSCTATINGGSAIGRPALRLDDFRARFGQNGLYRTVCQSDYSQALADIGTLLFQAISPCLGGSLDATDLDPNNPGIQPDCAVSEVTNLDSPEPTETRIPACEMSAPDVPNPTSRQPCWWMKDNPACTTTTNLEIHVEPPATAGTTLRVQCATK